MQTLHSDIFIAGGGLGGCAAALRAAEWGCTVILAEPCDWIGGQATSQGVSALDEHEWIEEFGGTPAYYRFRSGIRRHYQGLAVGGPSDPRFNPGRCWVSRLAFEPRIGLAVLESLLAPSIRSGRIRIFSRHTLKRAEVGAERIKAVIIAPDSGRSELACRASYFIDASEMGDLLPLAGVPFRTGAEAQSETGEPHAPAEAHPEWIQSFTFPFIVEYCPGENHTIPKPPGYEENRDNQPYTLAAGKDARGAPRIYSMFATAPGTPGSFWAYRRLIDAGQFRPERYPRDLSMINWQGNDYRGGRLIGVSRREREKSLAEARALSLGFLHWLQTQAPRDDGGQGYPELKLRPDLLGTADGLSQFPYIRESRRIRGLDQLREQDIAADLQSHARARLYPDAVAIGKYWIDLHRSSGEEEDCFVDTRPFQVPLGALIPEGWANLIAGAKNIGVTRLAAGACRLHPVEWAIGEAAGSLAAECLRLQRPPHELHNRPGAVRALQLRMVESGTPLFWFTDVGHAHPAFAAVQWLAVSGIIEPDQQNLLFSPDAPLEPETGRRWLEGVRSRWGSAPAPGLLRTLPPAGGETPWHPLMELAQRAANPQKTTRAAFAIDLFQTLQALLHVLPEADA